MRGLNYNELKGGNPNPLRTSAPSLKAMDSRDVRPVKLFNLRRRSSRWYPLAIILSSVHSLQPFRVKHDACSRYSVRRHQQALLRAPVVWHRSTGASRPLKILRASFFNSVNLHLSPELLAKRQIEDGVFIHLGKDWVKMKVREGHDKQVEK